jgi:hypothetical protein
LDGSGRGVVCHASSLGHGAALHKVGPLELSCEKLPIPDTDRQTLVVYHVEIGSTSAQELALLATTAAGEREPVRRFETD